MGRERIYREQKRLLFVLVCTDLSGNSRREIAQRVTQIPVLERYSSAEIEQLAHLPNTKIIGFKKSPISQRIFSLLKSTDQNPGPTTGEQAAQDLPESETPA